MHTPSVGVARGIGDDRVVQPTLTLAPAERADVVVDFSEHEVGSQVTLVNRLDDGAMGGGVRFDGWVERRQRRRCDGSDAGDLAMWTVNDQPYRPGVDIARPRLGTLERWRFTTDVHHPVHAHLFAFQVEQDGAPVWKDTIDVGPTSRAEVLVPIEGYRGRYVLHCHNLEHEDRMMMADFSVV